MSDLPWPFGSGPHQAVRSIDNDANTDQVFRGSDVAVALVAGCVCVWLLAVVISIANHVSCRCCGVRSPIDACRNGRRDAEGHDGDFKKHKLA